MADPITALIVGKVVATAIGKGVGAKAATLHAGSIKTAALSKVGDAVGERVGARVTRALTPKTKTET
jgi:hypothetical protein